MQCRIRKLTYFEIRDYIAYTLLAPDFTLNYIRAIHREIQKMTYTALFPMIVEEILSLNALSHHHIKKTLITIHNIKTTLSLLIALKCSRAQCILDSSIERSCIEDIEPLVSAAK